MSFKKKIISSDLSAPLVMAILNITPDSFSDGGYFTNKDMVKKQLELMVSAGVDIVDIGGESTRPSADPVALTEELDRVLPVVELIKNEFELPVSIDTYKVGVMSESIKLGVDLVNDINALQADGAKELVAKSGVFACLMHKKGLPKNMQQAPVYQDVVTEVTCFLLEQAKMCKEIGIDKNKLLIDPGFGFGKNTQHNISLFKELGKFSKLGFPLLVGVSRKKIIADVLGGLSINDRMVGSVSAAILASFKGAKIVRVHDFQETLQAFKIIAELR